MSRSLRSLLACAMTLMPAGAVVMTPGAARAEVVCAKSGTELDFVANGGATGDLRNTRDKLENPAYFGPGGTVAPETLSFLALGSVTQTNLNAAGCDIFIGGGFEGSLSAAEGSELVAWSTAGAGSRIVIGGCDEDASNQTCLAFGRTLTDIVNGTVSLNGALAYNPINCGGAAGVETFGGRSASIGLQTGDHVLATHDSNGSPAATTDSLADPRFLFTGDADMFTDSAITSGPDADTDQAVFVLNTFKFALDGIKGRLASPQCVDSYDDEADLAIGLTTDQDTVYTTGQIVATVAITNQGSRGADRVQVSIPTPSGFSVVSASAGQGTHASGTGRWDVGTLAGGASATLTVTYRAITGGTPTLRAQVVRSSLPDPDSAPNADHTQDDLGDGGPDDDEAAVPLTAIGPTPFSCDGTLFQIAQANSTLKRLNFTAGANGLQANLVDVASAGANLNAGWGYREQDDLIYGVDDGGTDLLSVDADGIFRRHGQVPANRSGTNAGDVLVDGRMLYKTGAARWTFLDVSDPEAPALLGDLTLTAAVNTIDFAQNPLDGKIYGVHGGRDQLFMVDPSGGPGTSVAPVFFGPQTYTGAYGAAWFDEDGRLYVWDNSTNEVHAVDVGANASGSGYSTLLATGNDEGGINDGAYCRGPAPVPLGSIAGTLYADANANDAFDGGEARLGAGIEVLVYSDGGTPLEPSDDIYRGTVETDAQGDYLVPTLPTVGTYRLEVDLADPDLPPNATSGTSNPILGVVVTADTTTTDQDFGFDPSDADLSVSIRAEDGGGNPITSADPGDTVVWVIEATNAGAGSPAGVRVVAKLPDGFAYGTDDAPATGDVYVPENGLWFVDELLPGATETLRITSTANASGEETFHAEIVASSLPDPDSDPGSGRLQDDYGDGAADDDEASATVSRGNVRTLSGTLFEDAGGPGATAHDAVQQTGEGPVPTARVRISDGSGNLLGYGVPDGAGAWRFALPQGYSGTTRLDPEPPEGWLGVSSRTTAISPIGPKDADGGYAFNVSAGTSYSNLDFGMIREPTLETDRVRSAQPGQVVELAHEYVATTTANVFFGFASASATPPGAFSGLLMRDANCDGVPEDLNVNPTAVVRGERVCRVVRLDVGGGAGPGAFFAYRLAANSFYPGTASLSSSTFNDGRVTVGSGTLTLEKRVRNVTKASAEGTANTGDAGDVLEYRLILSNPGNAPATTVTVNDRTPAWTTLAAPVPSPVTVAGVSCTLVVPGGNVAGYAGPLEWQCPGSFPPGASGSLTFQVRIDP